MTSEETTESSSDQIRCGEWVQEHRHCQPSSRRDIDEETEDREMGNHYVIDNRAFTHDDYEFVPQTIDRINMEPQTPPPTEDEDEVTGDDEQQLVDHRWNSLEAIAAIDDLAQSRMEPVSYTHLTLPTILLV